MNKTEWNIGTKFHNFALIDWLIEVWKRILYKLNLRFVKLLINTKLQLNNENAVYHYKYRLFLSKFWIKLIFIYRLGTLTGA